MRVTVSKERCTGIPLPPSDVQISKNNARIRTKPPIFNTTLYDENDSWWWLDDDTIDGIDDHSSTTTQTAAVIFHSEYIAAPLNEANVVPVMRQESILFSKTQMTSLRREIFMRLGQVYSGDHEW